MGTCQAYAVDDNRRLSCNQTRGADRVCRGENIIVQNILQRIKFGFASRRNRVKTSCSLENIGCPRFSFFNHEGESCLTKPKTVQDDLWQSKPPYKHLTSRPTRRETIKSHTRPARFLPPPARTYTGRTTPWSTLPNSPVTLALDLTLPSPPPALLEALLPPTSPAPELSLNTPPPPLPSSASPLLSRPRSVVARRLSRPVGCARQQ